MALVTKGRVWVTDENTMEDLLDKGFSGAQVRYMLLHTHYRQQLNFTFQEVEAVKKSPNHRYSASMGITKLRMAISSWGRRSKA